MRSRARKQICSLAGCGALLVGAHSGVACAQSAVDSALQTLLGGQATPSMLRESMPSRANVSNHLGRVPATPNMQARASITVKSGQSLSAIIRQHFRGSPFNEKFLQRAFLDLNPEAFIGGQVHRLKAGVRLWIPSLQDLVGYLQPHVASPVHATPPAQAGASASDRKHWIRYP